MAEQRCFMCKLELTSEDLAGLCPKCMFETFGEKMSEHIINNFKEAKRKGNLLFQDFRN